MSSPAGHRFTRPLVPIWIRVESRDALSLALVWGGQSLLGAVALEGLGVDPKQQRPVPVDGFIGVVGR